jgi:O-antigen ligase
MALGLLSRCVEGSIAGAKMRRVSFYVFLLFIFSIPWQNFVAVSGTKTLASIIGAGALLAALITCAVERRFVKPPAFLFALLLFFFWQFVTYYWSVDARATLSTVTTLVQIALMVWLVAEMCTNEEERDQAIQAFVFGCLVVCFVTVRAYLSGEFEEAYRYTAAGLNPNEVADVLAIGIPMAALLLQSNRRVGLLLWVNVLYLPIALFAIVLTASRSGFAAASVGLVGVVIVFRRIRPMVRVAWLVVVCGLLAGMFLGSSGGGGLDSNIQRITFLADTSSLGNLTGRTDIWSAGLRVMEQHFFGGTGAGTFPLDLAREIGLAQDAHNLFVLVGAESGLIGILILLLVLAASVFPSLKRRDGSLGFRVVLFLVLLTVSSVANVMTSKVLWFALAFLSLRAVPRAVVSESPVGSPTPDPSASGSGAVDSFSLDAGREALSCSSRQALSSIPGEAICWSEGMGGSPDGSS